MKYSIVLLLMFVIGCATEPKIPNPSLGSLSGNALLYSQTGSILPISSGITVTAEGTGKTAVTNDSGKWTISGLAAGTYTFTFTKSGFGSMKQFDFTTAGKDTISSEEIDLCQPVSDLINFQRLIINLSALDSIPSYEVIGAMEPPFLQSRSVVLCMSADSASLASDPASAPLLVPFVMMGSGYDGDFTWNSTNAFTAKAKPFAHGAKVFATICISGEGPEAEYLSNYFDPHTDRQVYTAIKEHSQILSIVMP
jgi:hypothetical protein